MLKIYTYLMSRKKVSIVLIVILSVGLILRLSHINFGLPLTYFIDEMDHTDPTVSYILNYKTAIQNHDFNFFKPSSYVYGTFPTYFLTISLILINTVASIFGHGFSQFNYVVVMRIVTALVSMLIPVVTGYVYYLLFKDKRGLVLSVFLTTLNWKLINHSIYVNQDTFLALSVMLSYLFLLLSFKYENKKETFLLICLSGAAFGLAFGTKITALIALPVFGLLFVSKRNFFSLQTLFP